VRKASFPIYVEFGGHVNFTQRYDESAGIFRPVPEPADKNYVSRYADDGREYLYKHIFRYWDNVLAKGEFGMIGEFAVWKMTPHPVALALLEDYLKLAKERDMGWALWEFRGGHGLCNSGRADVEYEDIPGFPGYTLDRKMYELLKRY
jgi:endoglucanase